MGFSTFGRAGLLAIPLGIALASGCSSSSPAPRAYVSATLTSTGGACSGVQGTQQILTIGTFALNSPTRVAEGGPIHITCTVSGSDPNFKVQLSASSDSTVSGGSLQIEGSGISVASGSQSLTAAFVGTNYGEYQGTNCTLTYSYDNVTGPGIGGVAPGRIWGHVSCPGAVNDGLTTTNGQPSTCDAEADFVFENCGS